MMKFIVMVGALLFSYNIYASQALVKIKSTEAGCKVKAEQALDFASANTYYGQEITPENIIQLAPKIESEVTAIVENFLIKNNPLGNILSGASYYNPILFYDKVPFTLDFAQQTADQEAKQAYFGTMRATFTKLGLNLKPGANYIIDLNDAWIIKASGFSNRLNNINLQVGNKYGSNITSQQLAEFKRMTDGGKTYQTISRLAYWLRAQEAKEKLGLDRICLPKQYLVHIPGRPHIVEDTNYVIVEEKIRDTKPLTDTPLAGDPEVIQQLTQLIGYTALWDINANNLLVKGNQVCIIDTEQPSVHKPLDFFHKDMSVHRDNVGHGWGELESHIIKPYGQTHQKDVTELLELKNAVQMSIQNAWA